MAGQGGGKRRQASPGVYRRRRLVVGIAALAVLILLVVIIVSVLKPGSKPASGNASSSESAAAGSGSVSPVPQTPSTPVCDQSKITVAAATDAPSYPAGKTPVFTLTVSNGGTVACDVNVGTSQMDFLVMSGSDRIFSSKDCQEGAADLVKSIAPGASEKANFPWQLNRTVEGCTPIAAKPGPGTYTLTATLGKLVSPKQVFTLNP
ncbi:hypothetical protein [Arthrobacter russicus]|uniref:Uncharacterized protein n=1 Tax=Arthrobacter russicus TaxID=172040 RepID=A0ABU1JDS7_9MICC|nr:hypothetical protein [Arthrobacter russicus]MBQ1443342.1 hypothetical protein [Renibacterium sp.]MDN5669053.1 hypothetical protein [Renibacterium salmoninarum]MDR6269586.1 hypothetical protein [Arthrobacter russicus]